MKKVFLVSGLLVIAILLFYSPDLKEIGAGIAILLFGMLILEEGFRQFSGGPLENLLQKTTNTKFKSILFGVISTSLLQSSSLISVITISFLSAGLLGLTAGIGIIFGANLGTTTGAWLIAFFGLKFSISSFALPILIFGIVLYLQKNKKVKGIGGVLAGIGFLFLGIHYMKIGFEAYQESIDIAQFTIPGIVGLFVFAGIGIVITVIMQSSHATLAIILTALSFNQITYHNALALAIGANVGTTITAIIGAASANVEGKKLAIAHLIFNFVTGLSAVIFIEYLGIAVDFIASKVGIGETDYTLKLAIFHTLFNSLGIILMYPFINVLVKYLNKTVKEKTRTDITLPKYINDAVMQYPETAIPALIKESRYLFDNAFEIISHGINLHRHDILSNQKLKVLVPESKENMNINIDEEYLKKVKTIYSKIIKSSSLIEENKLNQTEVQLLLDIKISVRNIVRVIKKIESVQKNMTIYVASENEHIRKEYNTLRRKVAKVLREIYNIDKTDDVESQFFKLEELKKKAQLHDVLVNGTLDSLIRDKLITKNMATSLMNDSAAVGRACEILIEVAEMLYIHSDPILTMGENYRVGDTERLLADEV